VTVILALVKCGPAAKETIPELAEVQQNDRDAKVRDYAAKALEKTQGCSLSFPAFQDLLLRAARTAFECGLGEPARPLHIRQRGLAGPAFG